MRHFTTVLFAGLSALCLGGILVGDDIGQARAQGVQLVTASVAILVGLRRYRPTRPLGWRLLAASLTSLATAYGVYTWGRARGHAGTILAFDAVNLVAYGFLWAWVALILRRTGRWQSRGDRLDYVLITTALVLPLYVLVLKPTIDSVELEGFVRARAITHPIFTVFLLAALLRIGLTRAAAAPLRLLIGMLGVMCASNIALAGFLAHNPHAYGGTPSYLLWWFATVVTGLLALQPMMRDVEHPLPPTGTAHLGTLRTVGVGAALLTPVATTLLSQSLRYDLSAIAALAQGVVMTGLVLIRLRDLLRESERARRAVERKEQYFRSIALNLTDALLVTDATGRIVEASAVFKRTFGAVGPGDPVTEILGAETPAALLDDVTRRASGTATGELAWHDASGAPRWFEVTVADMLDDEAVGGLVWVLHDVSERHVLTEQLRHQALHDALTGLPNRVLFADRLGTALARAARNGTTTGVFLIDLDNFKTVNDGLGHDVGDRLLVSAAVRLRSALRAADTLCRLGGDEFAVVAEDLDPRRARETARRLRDALREPFDLGDVFMPVTASIGVALGSDDPDLLLRRADVAMYQAKAAGRDDAALFDEAMELPGTEQLHLATQGGAYAVLPSPTRLHVSVPDGVPSLLGGERQAAG